MSFRFTRASWRGGSAGREIILEVKLSVLVLYSNSEEDKKSRDNFGIAATKSLPSFSKKLVNNPQVGSRINPAMRANFSAIAIPTGGSEERTRADNPKTATPAQKTKTIAKTNPHQASKLRICLPQALAAARIENLDFMRRIMAQTCTVGNTYFYQSVAILCTYTNG